MYDLYVQNDTLLLADVFENFRNMCLEIYERDPEGQKCESKLRFFNWYRYVVEEEYVTLFIDMKKVITIISIIMIKTKNHHNTNIGM